MLDPSKAISSCDMSCRSARRLETSRFKIPVDRTVNFSQPSPNDSCSAPSRLDRAGCMCREFPEHESGCDTDRPVSEIREREIYSTEGFRLKEDVDVAPSVSGCTQWGEETFDTSTASLLPDGAQDVDAAFCGRKDREPIAIAGSDLDNCPQISDS